MKKRPNPNQVLNNLQPAQIPAKQTGSIRAIICTLLFAAVTFFANAQVYTAFLNGPNEAPPNASPGTGFAKVTITGDNMRVEANFTGLTGTTTAAHIHAATAVPGTGTAAVATTTPTFPGFPSGVTSGTYDQTFDMTLAGSYRAGYITANGGTPAAAFVALKAAIASGSAYFNIHSTTFGGGEIRGFFVPILTEGFDAIVPVGWSLQNKSTSIGSTTWFQGNSTVFPALSGAPNSYAGVNFNSTTGVNTISNWMISPLLSLTNGAEVKFWARTVNTPSFPDRLQLRLSTAGSSTNVGTLATDVGDFSTLLVDVNPTLTTSGFPNTWTQYTATLSGITGIVSGRIAFRYFVTNGGPSGANSDYIGVDDFEYTGSTAPTCSAPTDRIYVDASAAPGGTGSSWACAINQLSTAITMANANMAIKSIWVADGTYKPGTARTDVLAITRADLMILGGFAGGEVSAMDANPAANPTIISGDIGTLMDASDNSYRLMNIGGSPVSASPLVVDGFVFENGNANGAGDKSVGAALLSNGIATGTPVWIKRSLFRNNNAAGSGGAVYLTGANLAFDACRFVSNTSGSAGGAVFSFQASPSFVNSVFVGNTAPNGGGYYGNYGYPTFNKTAFSGNSATYGGGVYQNRMGADYFNCVFNANTSYQGGAIYEQNASTSHILNSTFFKNTGVSYGGTIVLTGSNSSTVTENSIFWKNTHGGSATSPWADFVNYTGGANVYANNILQLNTAVPADNGTTRRFNKRGVDPLFVNELSPVGADVMWGTADDGLQLQNCEVSNVANARIVIVPPACSPAINAGDNAPVTAASLTTDERNNPRIACSVVDMGAYENQNCGIVITSAEQEVMIAAQILSSPKGATGIVANPITNDLQIRYTGSERASVVVFAESGKTIWSKNNIAEGITRTDASSWARGMYQVVIVTASGKRMNFKVVRM